MSDRDLVDICNSRLGWSISGQLDNILNGKPMDDQNPNALREISRFLKRYEDYTELKEEIDQYLAKAMKGTK